jgi:hypothetical protein
MLDGDSAVGLSLGTDLFINKQPDGLPDQDPIAAIYDTGGFPPLATGKVFDQPTIMVRVIGKDGDIAGARDLAQAIKAALHQRTPESIGGTRYMGIWQTGEIAFVEYDEKNRPVFSLNFRIHRTY